MNEIAMPADACEVDEDRDHIPVVLFQVARSYSKEGHLDQPAADLIVADDNKGSAGLSAIAATTVTTYSNRNTIRALEAIMFNPTQLSSKRSSSSLKASTDKSTESLSPPIHTVRGAGFILRSIGAEHITSCQFMREPLFFSPMEVTFGAELGGKARGIWGSQPRTDSGVVIVVA